jgi:hypothetical protein
LLVVGSKRVWSSPDLTLPAAEIYDATRDAWTPVTPPQHARESAGGALLPDGRVLIAGGRPGGPPGLPFVATAHPHTEIFDPATGSWSPAGDLQRPRSAGFTLTTLADGRVVALGGSWATIVTDPVTGRRQFGQIFYEATAEVFDAASATWRAIAPSPHPRTGHAADPLADGSLLVVGGVSGPDGLATASAQRLVPVPAAPAPAVAPPPPAPAVRRAGTARLVKPARRLKPTRTGTLTITVRCATGGAACEDRLVLRGRGRVLARRGVSVPAGRTAGVRVQLSRVARRALRNRTTRVTVTLERQGTRLTVTVKG